MSSLRINSQAVNPLILSGSVKGEFMAKYTFDKQFSPIKIVEYLTDEMGDGLDIN